MRKDYFTYTANASGFLIYYKHQCIGGTQITGKPRRGKGGELDKRENVKIAEAEIAAILHGWGRKDLMDMIHHIDNRFLQAKKIVSDRISAEAEDL